MTTQQKMKAVLEQAGIPAREISVYGSQIVVKALSRATAEKWVLLLGKFAKVRRIVESLDERKVAVPHEHDMTTTEVGYVKVWLVGAVIA